MRYMVLRMRYGLLAVICLALGVGLLAYGLPNYAIATSTAKRSLPIYSVETDEKKVAMAFNCAWDNSDVSQLIEILAEQNVKASFFVSGSWCKKYPESVKALYDAGHEIGSHSNTHADMTTLSKEEIQREIRLCNQKIEAITGEMPKLFRMPSGSYNDLVIETIREEGMTPIQWDCEPMDTDSKNRGSILQRTLG